ncbi:MAG: helix-turn-helix domain-containing protein [Candidatus Pacearchaeota archaeon]
MKRIDQVDSSLYYSSDEIVKMLGKSKGQILKMRKQKKFPMPEIFRVNGKINSVRPMKTFYKRIEVDKWIAENKGSI